LDTSGCFKHGSKVNMLNGKFICTILEKAISEGFTLALAGEITQ
jgi:hypothetical protein